MVYARTGQKFTQEIEILMDFIDYENIANKIL